MGRGGVREDFFFFKGGEKKRNKGKILAQNCATLAHTDRSLGTQSTHLKTKTKQTEEKRRKQTSYLNKFFLLLACFLELCLLLLLQPLQSLFHGLGWWHLEGNINHFRCTSPHARANWHINHFRRTSPHARANCHINHFRRTSPHTRANWHINHFSHMSPHARTNWQVTVYDWMIIFYI